MANKKPKSRKPKPAKTMKLSPLVLEHLIRAALNSRGLKECDRPQLVDALKQLKD